jgi:hypothetical protein
VCFRRMPIIASLKRLQIQLRSQRDRFRADRTQIQKNCRRVFQKVPKKGVSPTKTFSISVRFLSQSV